MLAQRVGRCDCVCMPRIIVTGGRGGLATALARHFRALGAEVHRPGREDLDVRRVESVEAYFSAFDQLDVLVNNAGITGDNLMAKLSPQGWDEVIDTNLKGAYLCSRAAARLMGPRRRGHIIQIGSFSALHPSPGQAAYAASKAALIGLTKSLAKELGPDNIQVNCVLPGFLETRMTQDLPEAVLEAARARHCLGRFNTVEESARFIAQLSGFGHISGQVFQLDSRV